MSDIRHLAKRIGELETRLTQALDREKKYREALEFYADEEKYHLDNPSCDQGDGCDCMRSITRDGGAKARQALLQTKGESE